jgi:hypothetical protein
LTGTDEVVNKDIEGRKTGASPRGGKVGIAHEGRVSRCE